MKENKLTGADYLLLLLYLNDNTPICSSVRLTKMMFLFEKEIVPIINSGKKIDKIADADLPEFFPYNFGPFSKDLYEQLNLFANIKFIKISNIYAKEEMSEVDDWEEPTSIDGLDSSNEFTNNADGKCMKYSIDKIGIEYVKSQIIDYVPQETQNLLSAFKTKIIATNIKDILRYVYIKYPEQTVKSLIKDDVLGHEKQSNE